MDALTIHEAAETTGWSPRMLRYIERSGLVIPARSSSGYRLYGPAELQRLRTLRELLEHFELGLSDLGFAARLRGDGDLALAVSSWFEAEPSQPEDVEVDETQAPLGADQAPAPARTRHAQSPTTPVTENA